jgi:hypothetical protein
MSILLLKNFGVQKATLYQNMGRIILQSLGISLLFFGIGITITWANIPKHLLTISETVYQKEVLKLTLKEDKAINSMISGKEPQYP